MNWFIALAFLFAVGSCFGWCLEFLFRNLVSHKGPKGLIFINPGFCRGPYLPIYGIGVVVMFCITYAFPQDGGWAARLGAVAAIGVCMSLIEFLGGLFLLKCMNLRLWDYTTRPGNIMGLVCPLFSAIWAALGAVYCLVIHPLAIGGLVWLSNNLAFSFAIGLFFGFFLIDLFMSERDALIVKEFARDHEVVVKYEELKSLVQQRALAQAQKMRFFNQLAGLDPDLRAALKQHLADPMLDTLAEHLRPFAPKK